MSNHKRKARDHNPMIAAAKVEGEAREARIDVEAKKIPNHEHLYLHQSLVEELFSLMFHAPPSTGFIANPEIARRLILKREIFRLDIDDCNAVAFSRLMHVWIIPKRT